MRKPLFAIPSFPGSNGEIDNMRTLKRCGFDCFVFRWNDSIEKLKDTDGYFFGAGFSYEDRGRSGMVSARDPLFRFMREEAAKGKVIIGNCNGAQVLVESGLIPLGDGLRMCLAHNAVSSADKTVISPGFLNEWVWITRTCKAGRCATSNWSGTLHIPIAHGEGRFVTRDKDLIAELKQNDQIAFSYSDAQGQVDPNAPTTPNGSMLGIAGICNAQGNVVALMPHPERTTLGDPYFLSVLRWIETKGRVQSDANASTPLSVHTINTRAPHAVEIFIDTVITNNEERTVEQAARRLEPSLALKQYRYVGLMEDRVTELLSTLSFFNPNKEIAYVRRRGSIYRWNTEKRELAATENRVLSGITFLRRDEPDTAAIRLGKGAETGICYDCRCVSAEKLMRRDITEVFCNPHASSLEIMS